MKIKLLIIIFLAIVSFIYNFLNKDLIRLFSEADFSTLIQTQIGLKGQDNYIGIIFDYLISILFNINIKDINSFFRIFGG